jgi:tetratricopeptide (TPR) repeat protein
LWRLIDAEYPEDAVPDELERERRSHEAYAAERRRLYIGQEETVAALLARLEAASDEPGEEGSRTRTTIVTAESGTGKSALIANTLARYREAHPDHVVIEHYIGSTSEASDPLKVIRRVSEEIKRLTGAAREVEADPEKLVEQFAEWLADASWWAKKRGVRIVLALDALDKLSERSDLRWLPKVTAPHVRVVVSSLEGAAVEAMRKRQPGEVQARPFTPEVARNYIVETLARRGRRLPVREVDRIVSHPRATLPIYLKTLVEELSVFGSHEGLSQRITECLAAQEPDDLFEVILARLEEDLGRDAVKKPLEAIWASANGMSEDELIGFTGVSPLDLARLRLSLDDVLYETSGLLRLAHAYASKGVEDRYAPSHEATRALHLALGLWWEKQEPGARMAMELNAQLYAAAAWEDLRRCLTEPRTGMAMVDHLEPLVLFGAWNTIATQRCSNSVAGFVESEIGAAWPSWRSAIGHNSAAMHSLARLSDFLALACSVQQLAVQVADEWLLIARGLVAESDEPQRLHSLLESLQNMASIAKARGDLGDALALYEERLAISGSLESSSVSLEKGFEMTISLLQVAEIERMRGEIARAYERCREALAVARELANKFRQSRCRRLVSVCLNKVGGIEQLRGEFVDAMSRYMESLDLARDLVDTDGSPQCHRDLSVSLQLVAGVERAWGTIDSSLTRYEESLAIARALTVAAETPERLRDLGIGLLHVGSVRQQRGEPARALALYEESLRIARSLAANFRTAQHLRDLSNCLLHSASVSHAAVGLDGVRSMYLECLEVTRSLSAMLDTPESQRDIVAVLNKLAAIESVLGNRDAASEMHDQCLVIARRIADATGTLQSKRDLAVALENVAAFSSLRRDLDSALAACRESMAISEQLFELTDLADDVHQLVGSVRLVAAYLLAKGDTFAAGELLALHTSKVDRLEAECGGRIDMLENCADFWEARAKVEEGKEDPASRDACATRAIAIRTLVDDLGRVGAEVSQ